MPAHHTDLQCVRLQHRYCEAEGEAQAMKIKADAEAYYNRTISASLTHNIVLEDWIEKWDGKMPQIQGSNNMMPMINFTK